MCLWWRPICVRSNICVFVSFLLSLNMSVRSRSRCALAKVREALQDLLPLSPLGINTAARRLRRRHVDRRWSVIIDSVTHHLKLAAR